MASLYLQSREHAKRGVVVLFSPITATLLNKIEERDLYLSSRQVAILAAVSSELISIQINRLKVICTMESVVLVSKTRNINNRDINHIKTLLHIEHPEGLDSRGGNKCKSKIQSEIQQ